MTESWPVGNPQSRTMVLSAPDLVLLDLSLPDGDGLTWGAELAASCPSPPILMLTARSDELDIVVGLRAGAVDYVSKPFRLAELLARIAVLLRAVPPPNAHAGSSTRRSVNDVELDTDIRGVSVGNVRIELRPREFDLLQRLMVDAGEVSAARN